MARVLGRDWARGFGGGIDKARGLRLARGRGSGGSGSRRRGDMAWGLELARGDDSMCSTCAELLARTGSSWLVLLHLRAPPPSAVLQPTV